MGGGGFLGLGPAPSAPAAPDYTGAAQATAQSNLEAARTATAANRVNQVTPYGNLTYSVNPESQWDIYGNPTWTATQTLAPEQKKLLDIQNQLSLQTGGLAQKGIGYLENTLASPFDTSKLASTGFNPGEEYQNAYMRRLQPQIQQQREQLNVSLANQGIPVGSEAWRRAQVAQGQKENDLLAAATTQGFGTGLQARQQGLQEASYLRNEPLNMLNALRTGSQVQGPNYVNSANQATTSGADLLSAAQATGQYNLGNFNAQQAAQSSMNQGLMGLGGSLGAAYMMSDIRTKENIVKIGIAENGLPVYIYEYKPEWKDKPLAGHGQFVGHMAHEVELVQPEAVITRPDGYKMINYGALQ